CALARLAEDDPQSPSLLAREQELLTLHEQEWTAPLQGLAQQAQFRRGLIEAVQMTAEALLRYGKALFRLAPVREVRLRATGDYLLRIANWPYLARLTRLDLDDNHIEPWGAQALASSQYVAGLTSLNLSLNHIGPAGAQALASSPHLTRLACLNLSQNQIGV